MTNPLLLLVSCCLFAFSCRQHDLATIKPGQNPSKNKDTSASTKQIGMMLDSFNVAAAEADFERYFDFFAADGTFLGTDATEHWDKAKFMVWAKPYFDKKTTWNFTSVERHVYFGKYPDMAWFDELLSTQMKICRGSGVVVFQNGQWKVQQYVLSMTIPNSISDSVIPLKSKEEDVLLEKLMGKQ